MKQNSESLVRQAHEDRRGQVLPIVAISLTVLLGFTGFAIDAGRLYMTYNALQASTDAAALAGAQNLPNSTAATVATSFSGISGGKNYQANLPSVTMVSGYPTMPCLNALLAQIPCVPPASANAIVVKQQVTVPMTFLGMVGAGSITLTATATAAMRGAARAPYNVAIVVDTTASMNSMDNDSNCSTTRINCALQGVQTFLSDLSPCPANLSSCGSVTKSGSAGTVANAVDSVAIYTFPAVLATSAGVDYCNGGSLTTEAYATPFPGTSTYQIVNFSSDYRTSDAAASLSTSSNLVKAVGTSSKSGCMTAKGGFGTYLPQAIYQAQAALVAQQAANPNTQNVLIVLSDGDATATCTTSSKGVCVTGDMPGAYTTSPPLYPSTVNECHQAITAAQAATNATPPTRVYTVAYGAEAAGCSSDTPAITPCTSMQQMATNASTFFSDYTATGGSGACVSASRPTTNLNQIFTEIAGDLTVARLIPNGTQ